MLYLKQDITNTVYSNLLDRGYLIDTISSNLVLNPDFTELGSEEIVNGDFANDLADWTNYGTTSAIGGIATIGASANSGIFQNILTNGKSYTATVDVTSYNGVGLAQISNGNGQVIQLISGVGIYTFSFTSNITSPTIIIRGLNNALFSVSSVSVKEVGVNWISQDSSVTFALGSAKIDVIYGLNRLKQNNVTGDGLSYRVTYVVSENISTTQLSFYSGLGYTILDGTVGTHTFDYTRTGINDNVIFTAANGTSITLTSISFQRKTVTPFSWLINITNDFTKESTTLLQIPETNVTITPGTNTVSYPIRVITTGTANGLNQEALLKDTGFYSYEIYKQDSITNLDINDAVVGKLVESGKALIYNADSEVTYKEQPDGNPNNFIYVPD